MKILLMGDASNYHYALSRGLCAMGHDVTVASDGSSWMNTKRQIDLSRRAGRLGGAILWIRLSTVLARRLKGYDVVQISNPVFVGQRPKRVRTLFDRLRRDNGAVFLTALANDTAYVQMCMSADSQLRYNEYRVDGRPTPFGLSPSGLNNNLWLQPPLSDLSQHVYDSVDGVVTALYEYHLAMQRVIPPDRLAYGGIPIDTGAVGFVGAADHDGPIRVLAPHHPGRRVEKGADIIFDALKSLPDIDLRPVTGLPYNEFVETLKWADVIVDQLYAYSPATTALLAMAMGKTVITGAEPAFEAFIGDTVPAINPDPSHPERLADDFRRLATLQAIRRRAAAARRFVEQHNDTVVVARRFVEFWNTRL